MQRVAAGQFWRTRTAEMFPSKAKLLRLPEWLVCLSASRLPLQFGKKKQKNKPKRKEEIHSFECLWGSAEWMHTMGVYTAEVFPAFRDCTSQYFVDWRINLRCFFFIKPFFFFAHGTHTHTTTHTHTCVFGSLPGVVTRGLDYTFVHLAVLSHFTFSQRLHAASLFTLGISNLCDCIQDPARPRALTLNLEQRRLNRDVFTSFGAGKHLRNITFSYAYFLICLVSFHRNNSLLQRIGPG